jgi:hypothetical protein
MLESEIKADDRIRGSEESAYARGTKEIHFEEHIENYPRTNGTRIPYALPIAI